MTFTPGVPFDGQSLLNSKPMVRGNFTSLYDTIDENHYPPNSPTGQGIHKKSVYVNDSSTTGTNASQVAAFPKTYDSQLQLMYRPPSTGDAGDMWPLAPMIRAYARYNLFTDAIIGSSLNLSFTKNSNSNVTVNITTPFPIGAPTANYIPIIFMVKSNSVNTNFNVTNITSTDFTLVLGGSASNAELISILILGG
jgi:hypothetical protein